MECRHRVGWRARNTGLQHSLARFVVRDMGHPAYRRGDLFVAAPRNLRPAAESVPGCHAVSLELLRAADVRDSHRGNYYLSAAVLSSNFPEVCADRRALVWRLRDLLVVAFS